MKSTLIASFGILALTGCQSPASIEQRLIGTWAASTFRIAAGRHAARKPPSVDDLVYDVMEITFTAEHKESWRYRSGKGNRTIAHWHLEGNEIVYTLESRGETEPAGTTKRERIKKITSDEVIFTDGHVEARWKRVP
jgi:hypothetical protein